MTYTAQLSVAVSQIFPRPSGFIQPFGPLWRNHAQLMETNITWTFHPCCFILYLPVEWRKLSTDGMLWRSTLQYPILTWQVGAIKSKGEPTQPFLAHQAYRSKDAFTTAWLAEKLHEKCKPNLKRKDALVTFFIVWQNGESQYKEGIVYSHWPFTGRSSVIAGKVIWLEQETDWSYCISREWSTGSGTQL